jgi:hypothetical protein
LFVVAAASAQVKPNLTIKNFYGTFVGQTVFESESGLSKRDLNVVVKPEDKDGFNITWTTISQRPDGSIKRAEHSVSFKPTRREGIYSSAMQVNRFGARVPLDPLRGDPYVWARIEGNKFSVYAMLITDEGGYEMQTYDRTLADGDMHLEFSRVRNGIPLKKITAKLERIDGAK